MLLPWQVLPIPVGLVVWWCRPVARPATK